MAEGFDVLIRDGFVIDGTGSDMFRADIGIAGDRIKKIGLLEGFGADCVIDAEGLAVTPGFIDVHSHGDLTFLMYPGAESALLQGITTVTGGNCGLSPAPLDDYWLMQFWEFAIWDEVEPYIYQEKTVQPLDKVREVFKRRIGLDISWKSFGDFLKQVEEKGISVNYIPLVGHGQIRTQVMGRNHGRPAGAGEIEKMKAYVREAMDSGAFGMSTGLDYVPGVFCDTSEIIELAKAMGRYEGIYFTHWRSSGIRNPAALKPPGTLYGLEEALHIGKNAEVQVQISHLSNVYQVYPKPPSALIRAAASATLELLESGQKDGVKAAFDVIPNTSGGIGMFSGMASFLNPWLKQAGTHEQFARNLSAADYRDAIKEDIARGKWRFINPSVFPYWDRRITILQCDDKSLEGKTLYDIAQQRGQSSIDALLDIVRESPYTKGRIENQSLYEEALDEFIRHKSSMICTDAYAIRHDRFCPVEGETFLRPHPNTYCAFIKYITEYGRDRIEDTIHKITGYPAGWLGINGRGSLKEGAYADVVILDLKRLKTNENDIDPGKSPDGVHTVIVNGSVVVRDGAHTGKFPGRVIRKNA